MMLQTYLSLAAVSMLLGIPAAAQPAAENTARSRTAFAQVYQVLTHPRCLNCHPAGDQPLQGDDSHPHAFRVRRGADGKGVAAVKCANCHQAFNQSGEHLPPGAPFPAGARQPPGEPRWHLPAQQLPLVFQSRSPAQLCRQLLDQRRNGHLSRQALIEHVSHDPLVLWGWSPGPGRTTPALNHGEFVAAMRTWIETGAACPTEGETHAGTH